MSDTDHKRPNRREIMTELAQVKRKLNEANARAVEYESLWKTHREAAEKFKQAGEHWRSECAIARTCVNAAEKRAEEVDAAEADMLAAVGDAEACTERMAARLDYITEAVEHLCEEAEASSPPPGDSYVCTVDLRAYLRTAPSTTPPEPQPCLARSL